MSETFEPIVPPPPPPPPQKSRTGMIVGIGAGVLALCLVCAVIAVALYVERTKIPIIANLFATPTPTGTPYSSTTMGINLYYPSAWVYQEEQSGGLVLFASSQDVIDATTFPEDGAAVVIVRTTSFFDAIPTSVDTTSPEAMLKYMVSSDSGFLASGASELEAVRTYTIQGKPAASTVYSVTQSGSPTYNWYMVLIVTGDVPIMTISISAQSTWSTYRPAFDGILNSMEIQAIK